MEEAVRRRRNFYRIQHTCFDPVAVVVVAAAAVVVVVVELAPRPHQQPVVEEGGDVVSTEHRKPARWTIFSEAWIIKVLRINLNLK